VFDRPEEPKPDPVKSAALFLLLTLIVFGAGAMGRQQLSGRTAPLPLTRTLPEGGLPSEPNKPPAPSESKEAQTESDEPKMTWLNGSLEEDFIRAGISTEGARRLVMGRGDGPYGDALDAITRCDLGEEDLQIVLQREGSFAGDP
jgi:hypothetical protein